MNKLQKIALLKLILATAGLLLMLLYFLSSNRAIGFLSLIITVIISSFILAAYVFCIMIRAKGSTHYDERDKSIHKISALAGFATFFFALFSASMISFCVGFGGSMFELFMPAALSLFFAESLATLIQYGHGARGEKS